MKKQLLTFILTISISLFSSSQTITFDDQGFTNGQILPNPYTIVNNSETFSFTISGGSTTNHFYRTSEGSCGSTGMSHIYSGNTAQTTWTIETTSGNEIDLGTIVFDNVFECFAFEYSLTLEGFKNNVSTGTQAFNTSGLNSIFTSNANFNDVDKIVITSSNLGNLGIDSIDWTGLTLSIDENSLKRKATVYPNPSSDFIQISGLTEDTNYKINNVIGTEINNGIISNNEKINIQHLTNGLYFLKFKDGNTIKFLKQ